MATFHSPQALVNHQRQRMRKVKRSVLVAHEKAVQEIKAEAVRLTSGTAKPSGQFARNRRNRRGVLPLLPINLQTGRLQRSLRVFKRGEAWQLQFTARHSAFVLRPGGTRLMVDRKFWQALRKFSLPLQRRRLLEAKRAAEK